MSVMSTKNAFLIKKDRKIQKSFDIGVEKWYNILNIDIKEFCYVS